MYNTFLSFCIPSRVHIPFFFPFPFHPFFSFLSSFVLLHFTPNAISSSVIFLLRTIFFHIMQVRAFMDKFSSCIIISSHVLPNLSFSLCLCQQNIELSLVVCNKHTYSSKAHMHINTKRKRRRRQMIQNDF